MANKHSQPRSMYGTAKAHGHPQAEEARRASAEAGQGGERRYGPEEAQTDVDTLDYDVAPLDYDVAPLDYRRADAALQRLVTEPGETWVLATDEPPEVAMAALAAWSQTRGVVVLCFGPGESFSRLSTKPGDTVILHTAHPEHLNQEALAGWAQSRGLALAVLPPDITVQQLDDATLDRMNLMRKPGGIIIPSAEQWASQNGRPG